MAYSPYYGDLGYDGKLIGAAEGFEVRVVPAPKNRAEIMVEHEDPNKDGLVPVHPKVAAFAEECRKLIAGKTIKEVVAIQFPKL